MHALALVNRAQILMEGYQWSAEGGIPMAGRLAAARARAGDLPVEIEVETIEELEEALAEDADQILLDNPTPELVREAVERIGDPERLEVSGGITLDALPWIVEAGARVISVGRITHSAPSLDLSLEVTDVD